ncbi:hypothetical protein SLEP1_g55417 [Rubroshorea leprosula]|uniref:Uncharacterized protein n=1 Tax=Rubroshorea leprosula TaxID=152421 RepID=A0AAV5MG91_9ROSI|nr:hypothetical protein SLEP1_g55417 [Rubroshorea leprosula]
MYHPSQTTSAPPSSQLSFFGFCCLKQILEFATKLHFLSK